MLKRVALLLTVVCLAGLLPGSLSCGESGDSDSGALVAAGEPPESSSTTMPSALRASYLAARQQEGGEAYHFAVASSGRAEGQNEASRLSVALEGGALRLAHEKAWELGLRWTGIGRGAGSARAPGPSGEVKVAENRASYLRADGSEEWYLNGPLGVEQGFVLEVPPEGARDQALVIEVSVQGGLTPALAQGGQVVVFRDAREATVAQYAELVAFDADGVELRSWLEVEDKVIRLRVDDAGAQYPVRIDPLTGTEQNQLTSNDLPPGGGMIGHSVSVSGNTAVIAAPEGLRAYVFVWNGAVWTKEAMLQPGPYGFGGSVSVSGDTAVVGASYCQGCGLDVRGAFVYTRSNGVWGPPQELSTLIGGAATDRFGSSVSVSNDTIVVGAPGAVVNGWVGAGQAYVYKQNGATWSWVQTLQASTPHNNGFYGSQVSVSGGTIVVGETGFHKAYVIVKNGATWTEEQILTGSGIGDFGNSVSVSGGTIVVGEPYGVQPGRAHVFVQSGANWPLQATLTPSDGVVGDGFGASVSVSGGTVVVGAILRSEPNAPIQSGAAYVFVQNGANWSQLQPKLTGSDTAPSGYFGLSVSVSGGTIVVGRRVANHAYVFRGCSNDADCTAGNWCAETMSSCTPELANGSAIPNDPLHTNPIINGMCTPAAAALVCLSDVCDAADNACGYLNGTGPCTPANANSVCRSGFCDAVDSLCGYANGSGPCTLADAGVVCRSSSCSANGTCKPAGGCYVDVDCSMGQPWCNESLQTCAALLANGAAIPNDPPHANPTLDGTCTAASGVLVCQSGVCDVADDKCGYANGGGACTPANAGVVCRSAACDANDSKCGYANGDGPCTLANAGNVCRSAVCDTSDGLCGYANGHGLCATGADCRSGACSANSKCMPAGGCNIDDDCAATDWCNEASNACAPKLPNSVAIPVDPPHKAPTLNGICTAAAGLLVCESGVCDVADNKCGYANGHGLCGADAQCRSGACSANSKCMPAGGCNVDADCAAGLWCAAATNTCMLKLANGVAIPSDPPHANPPLSGACTFAAAQLVCQSGVCDPDNKCGYADGHGPCTAADAGVVCRSGACSANAKCMPAGGCNIDADCAAGTWCAEATNTCTSKLANGVAIPNDPPHTSPTLSGACTPEAANLVCASAVCDVTDDKCGYADGNGVCTEATKDRCRSGVCSADLRCMPATAGYCYVDADCAAGMWCAEATNICTSKLVNGDAIPDDPPHTNPSLSGVCSLAAAQLVCQSGVCDVTDNKCGYADGHGACTPLSAGVVCRSGVCSPSGACTAGECNVDADCAAGMWCAEGTSACTPRLDNGAPIPNDPPHTSPTLSGACTDEAAKLVCASAVCDVTDDKCGYADGNGVCTEATKDRCRSGVCSADLRCMPATAGYCYVDADCAANEWCAEATNTCTLKLDNGASIPSDAPHTNPSLSGACTPEAANLACTSGVCDVADDKCGYADDHGPCAAGDVKGVCRSGACSANHLCMPAGGCNIDADCAPGTWCNQSDHACKDALEDGKPLPTDPAHTNPTLNGLCSPQAAVLVCKSLVCDPIKNLCGAQGLTQDKCTTDDDCKTVAGRGHCSREGVCCDQPCAGTCEQCLYPSVGTCSVQPGIDLHHECDKGAGGDADGGPEGEVNACGSSVCTPLEGAFGGECKPATSKTICSLGTCSQDGLHGTKPVYCSVEDGSSELACLAAAAEVFECTTDYRCDVGRGQCKTGCSTVNDCVPGFVCNLSGRCVPQSVAFTPSASSGCSLPSEPLDDAPWGRLALVFALALAAARRRGRSKVT